MYRYYSRWGGIILITKGPDLVQSRFLCQLRKITTQRYMHIPLGFFLFLSSLILGLILSHTRGHTLQIRTPLIVSFTFFFLATLLTRRVIPVFQLLDPSKSHINALLYQDRAKFLLFIPSTVINHVLYSKRPFSMLRPVFCHWHSLYGELSRTLSIRRMAIR